MFPHASGMLRAAVARFLARIQAFEAKKAR